MRYENLDRLVTDFIIETEIKAEDVGLPFNIKGSSQSCSSYFSLGALTVLVSDHIPRITLSHVDIHICIDANDAKCGDGFLGARQVFQRCISQVDEDEEVISSDWVDCGPDDEGAEFVGWELDRAHMLEVIGNLVARAKDHEPNEQLDGPTVNNPMERWQI